MNIIAISYRVKIKHNMSKTVLRSVDYIEKKTTMSSGLGHLIVI